ncbi:MAG: DegT/DnrJ/EryC1/StrS family aminotransferase [Armatimonadetes bacterium]|nr:DegT/DnrJ/EryC1/StrS family aminotransferase [Armatimonadota bacterium]
MNRPAAILGGTPAFSPPIPFNQPTLPPLSVWLPYLEGIYQTGVMTKGNLRDGYESKAASYLGACDAIAVSSCTLGLLLAVKALSLSGEVIVPSFTFPASVHILLWCGLTPVFCDIHPGRLTLDLDSVRGLISERTCAVLAVNIFGNPPPLSPLASLCEELDIPLIVDAAHGFGSLYCGKPMGPWGTVEVFSTSPTKLLVTGEGGLIATGNPDLAEKIRILREYGNPGDYDCIAPGLNARLWEGACALGILGLERIEDYGATRNRIACRYKQGLSSLPGITFQEIEPGARSSYKDFGILVNQEKFGISRNLLMAALEAEGIPTRPYFSPAVHTQKAYLGSFETLPLEATREVCEKVLCLPMVTHMPVETADLICETIRKIHRAGPEVRKHLP